MKIEQTDFDKWVAQLVLAMELVAPRFGEVNRKALGGSLWMACAFVADSAEKSGLYLPASEIYDTLRLKSVAARRAPLLTQEQIESDLKKYLSFKGHKVVTTYRRASYF